VPNDPYLYTNTVLLLHGDGTNGSTNIVDSSKVAGSPKTVTAVGNAQISTAQSKPGFGGSSISLPGGNDFLSTPSSADWNFGTGDLTIEAWVYIAGNSVTDFDGIRGANIVNTWTTSPVGWAFSLVGNASTTGTGLAFDTWTTGGNGTLFRATTTISQLTWHHVAATISGGIRRSFLNGTLLSGTTSTVGTGYTQANNQGSALRVGRTPTSDYPLPLNGYIDDLRITKGVARYTANFTPPTAPFPDF
jgi:hypothetical protein